MQPKPFGWGVSLLLLGSVIVLAIVPLLFIRDSEFGGADAAAEEAIGEVAPGYEPWFTPLFEPPGGETESLLFAVQAALGAGLIGYFFGLKHGQRMARPPASGETAPAPSSVGERMGG
ncbi:MAG: energy-coupling factor ABC transporter substrate-binding protein [Chloroflexaceae bacterium]